MENETRFDLNAAIENWRQELSAQPDIASEDRRELETHLCDAIAGFQQRGLNDDESFWLARRRVGQSQQLGEEFVKVDPAKVWRERVFWMLLAIFLSGTVGGLASSILFALVPVNSNSTVTVAMQAALFFLASLIPMAIAVSLAKGKLVALFSKLTLLVDNRRRLATTAIICIVLSSLIKIAAYASFYSRMNVHHANPFLQGLTSAICPLIIALLLVWLMPPQNRKTPRRA
jgi:hypothetical protein